MTRLVNIPCVANVGKERRAMLPAPFSATLWCLQKQKYAHGLAVQCADERKCFGYGCLAGLKEGGGEDDPGMGRVEGPERRSKKMQTFQ